MVGRLQHCENMAYCLNHVLSTLGKQDFSNNHWISSTFYMLTTNTAQNMPEYVAKLDNVTNRYND